jgi:hypothetical protein
LAKLKSTIIGRCFITTTIWRRGLGTLRKNCEGVASIDSNRIICVEPNVSISKTKNNVSLWISTLLKKSVENSFLPSYNFFKIRFFTFLSKKAKLVKMTWMTWMTWMTGHEYWLSFEFSLLSLPAWTWTSIYRFMF